MPKNASVFALHARYENAKGVACHVVIRRRSTTLSDVPRMKRSPFLEQLGLAFSSESNLGTCARTLRSLRLRKRFDLLWPTGTYRENVSRNVVRGRHCSPVSCALRVSIAKMPRVSDPGHRGKPSPRLHAAFQEKQLRRPRSHAHCLAALSHPPRDIPPSTAVHWVPSRSSVPSRVPRTCARSRKRHRAHR